MKRCRQAVLRTTVLGRNGKTVIRSPLTNRSRSRADTTLKIFHSSTNERRDILSPNVMPGEQAQIVDEIGGSGDERVHHEQEAQDQQYFKLGENTGCLAKGQSRECKLS